MKIILNMLIVLSVLMCSSCIEKRETSSKNAPINSQKNNNTSAKAAKNNAKTAVRNNAAGTSEGWKLSKVIKVNTTTTKNLDGAINVKGKEKIVVTGWAIDKSTDGCPTDVQIRVGTKVIPCKMGINSKYLISAYKKSPKASTYGKCGFMAVIPPKHLKAGRMNMYTVVKHKDGTTDNSVQKLALFVN